MKHLSKWFGGFKLPLSSFQPKPYIWPRWSIYPQVHIIKQYRAKEISQWSMHCYCWLFLQLVTFLDLTSRSFLYFLFLLAHYWKNITRSPDAVLWRSFSFHVKVFGVADLIFKTTTVFFINVVDSTATLPTNSVLFVGCFFIWANGLGHCG